MRPAQYPAEAERNCSRGIGPLLDGPLHDVRKTPRCIFRLTIKVFSGACGLMRLALDLRLGITSHPADAFLDFAADVLKRCQLLDLRP